MLNKDVQMYYRLDGTKPMSLYMEWKICLVYLSTYLCMYLSTQIYIWNDDANNDSKLYQNILTKVYICSFIISKQSVSVEQRSA